MRVRKWGCVEADSRNEEERGREGGKERASGGGWVEKKREIKGGSKKEYRFSWVISSP